MDIGKETNARPIFVTGVYRSGTTFVASLLGAHSDVAATVHTLKFLRFCLRRYGDLSLQNNLRNLVEDVSRRLKIRWDISLKAENILSEAVEQNVHSYAGIYDLLMQNIVLDYKPSASRWLEKVNCNWSSIPDFLEMFPAGKVIHVVRDPRDVTASYKFMTFEEGNQFLDAAFNCRGSMESFDSLDDEYRSRVLQVKVEDISLNPEENVRRIEAFLELDPDESTLNPAKFRALGTAGWDENTSFGGRHVGWPESLPRWPDKLTKPELLLVEMITQPFFSIFGYTPSGVEPSKSNWRAARDLLNTPLLEARLNSWLSNGKGAEGYLTDPYEFEMRMVFPERFE